MHEPSFLSTKLGRAALASVGAMTIFVLMSSQIVAAPDRTVSTFIPLVELA